MVTSVASGILVNAGHLLENLVFTSLRRSTSNIYYYKTKSGREVDFIVQLHDRSRLLVQVCESLQDPQTKKREIGALSEAMVEMNLSLGTIITRNEEEQIATEGGKIRVIPVWKFLLEN